MIAPPQNRSERVGLFGQPIQAYGDLRLMSLDIRKWWPDGLPLSWSLDDRATSIRCHRLVAVPLAAVFNRLQERNALRFITDYGGGWAYRKIRGSGQISLHSFGIAVDFNALTNPMGEYGDMPFVVVEAFERFSFTWGGRWTRPDGMHFQWGQ